MHCPRPLIASGTVFALTLVLMCSAAPSRAQDWSFGFEWGPGYPLADAKDYVDAVSWRNFGLDVRTYPNESFSYGFATGWHIFHDKFYATQTFPSGAVTGTQFRYLNVVPLLATGHYYFGGLYDRDRPYVGLGVGASSIVQRFEVGIAEAERSNWHFTMAPEVGYMMGTGMLGDTMIVLRAAYYYDFSSGEDLAGEKPNYSYVLTSIGIAFR